MVWLRRIAILSTCMAAVVVMLGAWTRLVDAGLGCPDWPGCYGFLTVPQTPEQLALAEARFPEHPVEHEKGWPEMIHRYFASSLGLLIIAMLIISVRESRRAAQINAPAKADIPVKHCAGLLSLVILQGMFGMWTVTLKLWPQVVSGHLLGGFATLSLLFLLALRLSVPATPTPMLLAGNAASVLKLAVLALVLVVVQIFLGAWTASNYAALACGSEFPGCHQSLWPHMDFAQGFNFMQSIGPNYLGGQIDNDARTAIHYTHRLGALVLTGVLLLLMYRIWRLESPVLRQSVKLLACVLTLQLTLGIANVLWLTPLPVAIAHNAVGAGLLLSMVLVVFRLHRASAQTRAEVSCLNAQPTT